MEAPTQTPSPATDPDTTVPIKPQDPTTTHVKTNQKMGKLKLTFLYTLIGGLIISALISVTAILIGEFNDAVTKALLTTLIFVTHSLLLIAIVSADKENHIGKSLTLTVVFASIVANMITTTLGIWNLWADDSSWKAFMLYMLLIGTSFLITMALKLRLGHKPTDNSAYITVCFVALLTLLLLPWILVPDSNLLVTFYYRLIGAVAILAATTLSIVVITNRITVSQHPALKPQTVAPHHIPTIHVLIAIVVTIFWIGGLLGLTTSTPADSHIETRPYPSTSTPKPADPSLDTQSNLQINRYDLN